MSLHRLIDTLATLTSGDLEPVAAALDAGRYAFSDAPYQIIDIWTLQSDLSTWQEKVDASTPLTPAETVAMLADIERAWMTVAALLAGGLSPT